MIPLASVPFGFTFQTFAHGSLNVVRVDGLVRLDEAGLVLEYRETRTVYGVMETTRGEVERVTIPVEQVALLRLRRRFFQSPVLELKVHSLEALQPFPYATGSSMDLPVARGEKAAVRELCGMVAHRVADVRLRQLEAGEPG